MLNQPKNEVKKSLHTLVVGASTNPDRYAHRATLSLLMHGHRVSLFGPRKGEVSGIPISTDIQSFTAVHTVTMYVGPQNQDGLMDGIISLRPQRVIFNPGTENPVFYAKLHEAGIPFEEACTLVLLGTGQY
jgi:predicted CoA-binding protein